MAEPSIHDEVTIDLEIKKDRDFPVVDDDYMEQSFNV
jgi:hypothetical protein